MKDKGGFAGGDNFFSMSYPRDVARMERSAMRGRSRISLRFIRATGSRLLQRLEHLHGARELGTVELGKLRLLFP